MELMIVVLVVSVASVIITLLTLWSNRDLRSHMEHVRRLNRVLAAKTVDPRIIEEIDQGLRAIDEIIDTLWKPQPRVEKVHPSNTLECRHGGNIEACHEGAHDV